MSARYLNSPELHLRIGDSSLRRRLLAFFALCAGGALWCLFCAGYPLVVALLLPVVLVMLVLSLRDRASGATLRWRAGCWTLERAGVRLAIEVLPGSSQLSWVVLLVWRSGALRGRLWVFRDSVPAAALRGLCSRLALER